MQEIFCRRGREARKEGSKEAGEAGDKEAGKQDPSPFLLLACAGWDEGRRVRCDD